jgi:hypothetical protein
MHTREVAAQAGGMAIGADLLAQAAQDLLLDHVLALLLGAVLRQPVDARLGREPVALAVLVQVGGTADQPPQRVAEGADGLAGLDAAQLDRAVLQTLVGHAQGRRRAQIERAGHPPRCRVAPQVGVLAVEVQRQRVRPVDGQLRGGQRIDLAQQRLGHAILVGVVDQRGEQHGAAGGQRAARPPQVQRRGVAVADRLLAGGGGVDRVEWQSDLDQFLGGHGSTFIKQSVSGLADRAQFQYASQK